MSYLRKHGTRRVPLRLPLLCRFLIVGSKFDGVGFDTATPQITSDFARGAL
jgi:hypothetical protein